MVLQRFGDNGPDHWVGDQEGGPVISKFVTRGGPRSSEGRTEGEKGIGGGGGGGGGGDGGGKRETFKQWQGVHVMACYGKV